MPIFKGKGDVRNCNTYGGVKQLEPAIKITKECWKEGLEQWFSTFLVPWPISRSHKSLWPSFLPWPTFSVCRGPLDYVCDVMMKKLLVEVISKKKRSLPPQCRGWPARCRIGVDIQRKKVHCASDSWVLVRIVGHMNQHFSISFDLQTHY